MITATGKKEPYITELTDGIHLFSADTPLADGGSGLHQRPTDILISALAACVNITTRMLLDKESLPYDRVVVQADLDRIDPDHPAFTAHVDIQGDIPREKKEAIIARVSRCPVCKLLRSPADVIVS
ncbi:MAG: OsmC family peroxiredoxin [Oscillospiraceae bacterium]|jgi:putative redox protein|nr:OsmC family peroxiredoxin [Oscillospiraceae bacterium]